MDYAKGYKDGQADMQRGLVEYVLSCKESGVNYVQVYDVMAENMRNFALLTPAPDEKEVPFSFEAVIAGYWEYYHDDDCGVTLDPYDKFCHSCGFTPDMQSLGARRVKKLVKNQFGFHEYEEPEPTNKAIKISSVDEWPISWEQAGFIYTVTRTKI